MTKPSVSRHVVIGVDTHKLTHHAAVLHADTGKLLAEREFPRPWPVTDDYWPGHARTEHWSRPGWKALAPTAPACNDTSRLAA